jgi:hypothetical protein
VDAETGEVVSWGRYRRTVSNLNLNAAPSENLKVVMSLTRGEDDPRSIEYGRDREENMAAGGEFEYRAGRSRLNVSLGASRTGTKDTSSVLSHQAGLAWEVEARTNLAGHAIQARTFSMGRTHRSFAGVSGSDDRRGFGLVDRFSILRKKVSLGLGYDQYQDNLDGTGASTVTARKPWMKAVFRPDESLPRLDVSARLTKNSIQENKGSGLPRDNSSIKSTVGLSRNWKMCGSSRVSPELRFSYVRKDYEHGPGDETRTLSAGTKARFGKNEAAIRLSWSDQEHDTPGLDRSELSLEMRQEVAAGLRFRIKARETVETLRNGNGSHRNQINIDAQLAYQLVPGKISVSGSYRYRDSRLEDEDWEDVTAGHGLFLAVTANETVRVLGR